MNKVINIASGIFLAIFSVLVMSLAFDLSVSGSVSLKAMPYKREICAGFAILIFLLGALRIRRRWQGAGDMKKFSSFHFVRPIAQPALNLGLVFTLAESAFMLVFLLFLGSLVPLAADYVVFMIPVILILLIDSVAFAVKTIMKGPSFRIGISNKAVAYFNREIYIFYYTGLIRVELHQDMINFQYKEDLNLFLPLEVIRKEDLSAFKENLIETLENRPNKRKIYIDDAFRSLE